MSVKFQQDTLRQTGGVPLPPKGKHPLADEIGTALTGGQGNVGQPGYLAVSGVLFAITESMLTVYPKGLSQAASVESSPDQDVDIGGVGGFARIARVVDCKGSQ
jgi:hypothetical protein